MSEPPKDKAQRGEKRTGKVPSEASHGVRAKETGKTKEWVNSVNTAWLLSIITVLLLYIYMNPNLYFVIDNQIPTLAHLFCNHYLVDVTYSNPDMYIMPFSSISTVSFMDELGHHDDNIRMPVTMENTYQLGEAMFTTTTDHLCPATNVTA